MRSGPYSFVVLRVVLAALALAAPAARAQTIDRMVAIVDGEVVTQGDIEEYRVLAEFFGAEAPADDGVVLRQIIEDRLIATQIARFPGNAVRPAEVEAYLAQFGDPGDLPADLLLTGARRRVELDRYYASLRRLMRVTDAEIQALYENEFVPEVRARGEEPVPSLAAVRGQLEEIVIADKLSREIAARIESLYRQYEVEVVE